MVSIELNNFAILSEGRSHPFTCAYYKYLTLIRGLNPHHQNLAIDCQLSTVNCLIFDMLIISLLAGLDSGNSLEITDDWWEQKRDRLVEKINKNLQ